MGTELKFDLCLTYIYGRYVSVMTILNNIHLLLQSCLITMDLVHYTPPMIYQGSASNCPNVHLIQKTVWTVLDTLYL